MENSTIPPESQIRPTFDTPHEDHEPELYLSKRNVETLDTLDDITDEKIQFFHEEGYLSIQQAIDPSEVEAAKQAMWDLIDGKQPEFKGVQIEGKDRYPTDGTSEDDHFVSNRSKLREKFYALPLLERRDTVRKLFNFVDHNYHLKYLSEHPGILSVLNRIMGEPPVLFQDMALMKPPHGGREKPWHQDNAYFNLPTETTTTGVWIALDEATPENGGLHLIPGSHREGPMLHFKRRDWQICDTDVQTKRGCLVPLKPGGCLIWHGLVQHGSPLNQSADRRRALQYHYKPQSTPDITGDERLSIYGGEGLGVEC